MPLRAFEGSKGTECLVSTRMVRGQSAKGPPEEAKVGEMRGTGSHTHVQDSDGDRLAPWHGFDCNSSVACPTLDEPIRADHLTHEQAELLHT